MDILVLSDSHGAVAPMVRAVELARPDLILHLGDCWRDGERLRDRFPDIPLEQVPGNCDFLSDAPTEQLLVLGGKRILMCHGHTYRVKTSLLLAGCAAEEQQLDLFLFGHTHQPLCQQMEDGLWVLNPGPSRSSYGTILLEEGLTCCTLTRLL